MKEIDWEERHFQICLALIQGEATKPATPSFPYKSIIKIADNMVDTLKKHAEKDNAPVEELETKKDPNKKSNGLWAEDIKAIQHGISMQQGKKYYAIWNALQGSEYGFEKGSDIPFSLFSEACEGICDVDDIDLEKFSEIFDVNIG